MKRPLLSLIFAVGGFLLGYVVSTDADTTFERLAVVASLTYACWASFYGFVILQQLLADKLGWRINWKWILLGWDRFINPSKLAKKRPVSSEGVIVWLFLFSWELTKLSFLPALWITLWLTSLWWAALILGVPGGAIAMLIHDVRRARKL
jgi:hypothetical protein